VDEEGALEDEDEIQPPNLTEDDAMEMAISNNELDNLAQWDVLAIQLRAVDSSSASSRTSTASSSSTTSSLAMARR
jgi:hypothetical protein